MVTPFVWGSTWHSSGISEVTWSRVIDRSTAGSRLGELSERPDWWVKECRRLMDHITPRYEEVVRASKSGWFYQSRVYILWGNMRQKPLITD